MKLSTIYGKSVVSMAGRRGYVISVLAEGAKLMWLTCADENEREFHVAVEHVIKFGEDITFRGDPSPSAQGTPIRLGRAVYDEKGGCLGILEDFTFSGNRLQKAKIGKKNYPAEGLIHGDVILMKSGRTLRYDVQKDGKVLFRKGTPLTAETLDAARKEGEYVQVNLKSI